MEFQFFPHVFIVLVFLVLAFKARIVPENARFAVFKLGKFMGLKGPGIVLKLHGRDTRWKSISVGDRGELLSRKIGQFHGAQIPVEMDQEVYVGSVIRITGFTASAVQARLDPDQRKKIVCTKCGHEMSVGEYSAVV